MTTTLFIQCMYCGCSMGEKAGLGTSGISHSICRECWEACFPEWGYPDDDMENKED